MNPPPLVLSNLKTRSCCCCTTNFGDFHAGFVSPLEAEVILMMRLLDNLDNSGRCEVIWVYFAAKSHSDHHSDWSTLYIRPPIPDYSGASFIWHSP